ncbi:MAG TPA: polyphosphate polymerase domain-containing protein, partial [Geothrix sp.]|nr:polyphosphate polymerase domain-containing protein [Geothrix sp.]
YSFPSPPMEIFQENIEQKFIYPAGQARMLRDWLEYRFVPDPHHHAGVIHSIYYDTPALHLYGEKLNSDYQKTKVRLRWYGSEGYRPDDDVICFLEIKRKFGAVRRKRRESFPLPARILSGDPFSSQEVWNASSRTFANEYVPPGTLVPVAEIRYRRLRYVDPETGSRLSLDFDIRCERANTALFPFRVPVYLDSGVLEQKGPSRFLLPSQGPIAGYLRKCAFSKYAECIEGLQQPLSPRR